MVCSTQMSCGGLCIGEVPPGAAGMPSDGEQSFLLDWPLDLVRLIIAHVPPEQHSDLRLVNTAFCTCLGANITSLHASSSKAWKAPPLTPSKLVNVERIDVSQLELRSEHWEALQHMARYLPGLNHIRVHSRMAASKILPTCAAALSCLTRLDLPTAVLNINLPADVQLPALKAACFGVALGTAQLAAFAPNLEHLCCEHLQIATFGNNVPMPSVTHFGGARIFQRASSSREAAAIAAAEAAVGPAGASAAVAAAARHQLVPAFPNLKVLFKLPQGVSCNNFDGISALAPTTSLQAIRGTGRFRGTQIWQELQQQQHLQQVSLHDEWGISGFQGISQLTQLQQLRLTGTCSGENASLVLQQISMLPQIQLLQLPAELLCHRCCPDASNSLAALAGKSSLRQLVFLQLQPLFDCPHEESRQQGMQHVTAAAGAKNAAQSAGPRQEQQLLQESQLQQLQQPRLVAEERIEQETCYESLWKDSSSSSSSSRCCVWGVYS